MDEVTVFSTGEMIRIGKKAKYASQGQTLHHKSHVDRLGIYDVYRIWSETLVMFRLAWQNNIKINTIKKV